MYPRIRKDGCAYYITTNTRNRLRIFTQPSFIISIIDSLNFYRFQHNCKLLGYVIMPDHVHLLIYPAGESSVVSDFMRDFKRFTSGRVSRQADLEHKTTWIESFSESSKQSQQSEKQVWQESFWEQMIYSDKFLYEKLNYIHMNPVRAGIVDEPSRYPYSSYRNYEFDDNTLIEIDKDWAA